MGNVGQRDWRDLLGGRQFLRTGSRYIWNQASTDNGRLEESCDSYSDPPELAVRYLHHAWFHRPLLPASAIESLSCGAVSKTPPIDVIELAVEPLLLP